MLRNIAYAGLIVLIGSSATWAKDQPANPATKPVGQMASLISSVDVARKTADGKPMKASTLVLTLEPNATGVPHRHPGDVYGYILEGEFAFKVEGKPEQILKAGETFYEPPMILHEIGSNPSSVNKTRVLVVMVHPADAKELALPEPQGN